MHSRAPGCPRPRTLLAGALLLAAGAVGLGLLLRGESPPRPSIVLVVWDTCRYDRLSLNGYDRPTTPLLEEFARDAVTFRHAYAPSPWTAPSHASIFTGLLPSRHGLMQAVGAEARVRPGIPLLAETLGGAGYETRGFTCNAFLSPMTGLDRGFAPMVALHHGEQGKGTGARVVEGMRNWLEARRGTRAARERPLFLFVNLMEAHVPRDPPPAALDPVRDPAVGEFDLRRGRLVDDEAVLLHTLGVRPLPPEVVAASGTLYDGACREMDAVTGEILGLLRAEGLLEGAVVVVTSDHGEALGEHGEMGHRMSVRDTLLHVPLVVRWPGRLEGGRVEEAQVRLQDLHPTLLEAAGLPPPPGTGLDAASLGEVPLRPRTVVAEFHRPPMTLEHLRRTLPGVQEGFFERFFLSLTAVQKPPAPGARKYVRVTRAVEDGPESLLREELYDLAADPGEERDLLAPGGPPGEGAAAERLGGILR